MYDWNVVTISLLSIVCSCFHTENTELSNCNTDCMATKSKMITKNTCSPLYSKLCGSRWYPLSLYPFNKYLLGIYCVQDTFKGAGNITLNKTNACLHGNKSINNIDQIEITVLKKNLSWREDREE